MGGGDGGLWERAIVGGEGDGGSHGGEDMVSMLLLLQVVLLGLLG